MAFNQVQFPLEIDHTLQMFERIGHRPEVLVQALGELDEIDSTPPTTVIINDRIERAVVKVIEESGVALLTIMRALTPRQGAVHSEHQKSRPSDQDVSPSRLS